jgi:hypothetical protein
MWPPMCLPTTSRTLTMQSSNMSDNNHSILIIIGSNNSDDNNIAHKNNNNNINNNNCNINVKSNNVVDTDDTLKRSRTSSAWRRACSTTGRAHARATARSSRSIGFRSAPACRRRLKAAMAASLLVQPPACKLQ